MLLKAGYYYDESINDNRDLPPKGHNLFVMSSGHSKPISRPCIETVHRSRRDFQLLYIQQGKVHYFDKDNTEHIAYEGSFILYKPLEFQRYQFRLEENADIYWCHFSGPYAEILLKKYNLYNERVIVLSHKIKFRHLYTSMRLALENKPKYYTEICSHYLQALIVTIGSEVENEKEKDNIPETTKNAIKYISEYYFKNITVTDLAKTVMSNKNTLTRQFVKYLNCTPKKYINKFRIEKAKTFLLQTNHKINEIALSVGFQDPLHFSTAFRSETGISPREFRNQNK